MIGLLSYLFVCVLLVLAGVGLIRLLRVSLPADVSWLLGAGVAHALVAMILGISVVAQVPLKRVASVPWLLLVALAIYAAADWRRQGGAIREARPLLVIALLAAPIVMLPYFVLGLADYPGSGLLDGWSYAAFGQYLWEYPRDTEGGLAPLYQYAVHLGHTRFIASGELGWLSVLSAAGDTQSANGLLRAVSIFGFASSCGAWALARGVTRPRTAAYIAITAISGWTFNVVWANNYDHGLALQYFPALATLAVCLAFATPGGAAVTALVAAGALYTYPEFALLALAIAGVLALEAIVVRRARRAFVYGVTVVPLLTFVLLAPYWADFHRHIVNQVAEGLAVGRLRPGTGYFPGLLLPAHLVSALMGLGGERLTPTLPLIRTAVAACLVLALIAGVLRMLWRRELAMPLIIVGLSLLVGVSILRQQYDYGAYKFLSLGWWAFALAIVSGPGWLDALSRARFVTWSLAGLLLAASPAITAARAISELVYADGERISQYRPIEQLPAFLHGAPLLLNPASVFAEHWGVYYLRHADVRLGLRNGYLAMPHLVRLLDRSESVPPDRIRYVVTDAGLPATERPAGWRLVWGAGRYAAWDTAPGGWAAMTRIHDALGNDVTPSPYVHAGPPGVTLQILASRAGTVRLSTRLLNFFTPTDRSCWQLAVTPTMGIGSSARTLALRPGAVALTLPVAAGESDVALLATPAKPTPYSATPEAAREGSLADTTTVLLPATARSGTDGASDAGLTYTACEVP